MRHELTLRFRLGLMVGACGALLALGSVAHAQQATDDDEDSFEQRIIKSILGGLGVNVGGGAGIDYRERSPLVIPPSLDLPPPDAASAAARNPAWPRAQERKKVAVQNRPNKTATTEDPGGSSRMTPDELRRGANPNAQRVTDPSKSGSQDDSSIGRAMTPRELGWSDFSWKMFKGSETETAKFEGEPGRGSLTQPPPGYQTPSPTQPYGVAAEKPSGWKIPNILDRAEGLSGGKDY